MNATNTTSFANITTNKATDAINYISDIVGYYVISVVSFIGILLNIFILFILRKKELKHDFYKYLWVKAIVDLMICIFGLVYLKSVCSDCPNTISNTYWIIFYQWYMVKVNLRTVFAVSSIHEIYMITVRYYIIRGEKKWFLNIKLKFYIPLLLFVPILLSVPSYVAVDIKPEVTGDLYYWTLSELGNSLLFKVYGAVVLLPGTLILLIVLTVMNILTIKAFYEYTKKKAVLLKEKRTLKDKQKIRFTRIMIILTVLFIISELCIVFTDLFGRLIVSFDTEYQEELLALGNCLRQFGLLFVFAIHSLDLFVYVPMDKNMTKLVKTVFSKNKQESSNQQS